MLWKTHIRITLEVFNNLGIALSSDEMEKLREGAIAPDKWGLPDLPHHYGKKKQIHYYILESRKCFLRYDLVGTYFFLGIALHYIQDSYVSMASFYPKHHSWEESIEKCSIVSDLEKTIRFWLRNNTFEKDRCLRLASSLSVEPEGRDNTLSIATLSGHQQFTSFAKPIVDYNLGFRASYLIAKSVLSPRTNQQLNSSLKQSIEHHKSLLLDSEMAASQDIIQHARAIKNLRNKLIAKSGMVPKLKNTLIRLTVGVRELRLNHKYKKYTQKKHLLSISTKYNPDNLISPYIGWYKFTIPKLDINAVKNELIPIHETSMNFAITENDVTELVRNGRLNSYNIGNQGIIVRRELNGLS